MQSRNPYILPALPPSLSTTTTGFREGSSTAMSAISPIARYIRSRSISPEIRTALIGSVMLRLPGKIVPIASQYGDEYAAYLPGESVSRVELGHQHPPFKASQRRGTLRCHI